MRVNDYLMSKDVIDSVNESAVISNKVITLKDCMSLSESNSLLMHNTLK